MFLKRVYGVKFFLLAFIFVTLCLVIRFYVTSFQNLKISHHLINLEESKIKKKSEFKQDDEHRNVVKRFLKKREKLSNLGRILFLYENRPPSRDRQFKIMIYKIGPALEDMALYFYRSERHDPFEDCSVKNCILSYDDDFQTADAVLFHLHKFDSTYNTPNNVSRPSWQRWIFFSMESASNTFMLQPNDWFNYSGIFNWSMTLSMESDIPVAAGRIVPLKTPIKIPDGWSFQEKFKKLVPFAKEKRRDVLVTIMSTYCESNGRNTYIQELQKYLAVDVFGRCELSPKHLKDLCPWKGYGETCQELRKYLFYLSFENSNCNGYASEKVYLHALKMGGIPVYMGMYEQHLDPLVPPNSYVHIDNFKSPKDLAKFILHVNETLEENYLKYHEWRKDFDVFLEDGYMGSKSYHYCRICEALNYNDEEPKIYEKKDLAYLLDPTSNCFQRT